MEQKATDALLADHKMIRKLLNDFRFENPRFNEISKTLHRVVLGHAYFEDEIFLPAIRNKPPLDSSLVEEMALEHRDINRLLELTRYTDKNRQSDRDAYALQLVTLLNTHFTKEEDAIFPLAEKILDLEGLNKMGQEMKSRQLEIRNLLKE